jgi:hypothetical protein
MVDVGGSLMVAVAYGLAVGLHWRLAGLAGLAKFVEVLSHGWKERQSSTVGVQPKSWRYPKGSYA